jgi:hypothetical protein
MDAMKLHRSLIAFAVGICAVSASAQDLKPGLWQVTSKMTSAGGEMEKAAAEMQQQMASMPPEQRRMMEEMMAKQGVKLGAGGPGEMVTKLCMTKEMVERNELPAQQGNCKNVTQPRSGNTVKMTFVCTDPASSGEGQYTIVNPEAYTTKLVVRSTAQGKPETTNIDAAGKWLTADCGNVKPMRAPAAK